MAAKPVAYSIDALDGRILQEGWNDGLAVAQDWALKLGEDVLLYYFDGQPPLVVSPSGAWVTQ